MIKKGVPEWDAFFLYPLVRLDGLQNPRISARLGRQFIGPWRPEANRLTGSALPRGCT